MARKRKTKGSAARRVGYAAGGIVDSLPGTDWQGPRSEALAYQSKVDSFNHWARWRAGHKLSGMQRDEMDKERQELLARGGALAQRLSPAQDADQSQPAATTPRRQNRGCQSNPIQGVLDYIGAPAKQANPGLYDDFGVDGYAEGGVVTHSQRINARADRMERRGQQREAERAAQPTIAFENSPESDAAYRQQIEAAGGRVVASNDVPGVLQYEMPANVPVTGADVGAYARRAGLKGDPNAFSSSNIASARAAAQAHEAKMLASGAGPPMTVAEQLRQMQVDNARWRVSQNPQLRRNPAAQAQALADLNTAEAGVINNNMDTASAVERRAAETAAERARTGIAQQVADTGDFTARSNAANAALRAASQGGLEAAQTEQARVATRAAERDAARLLVPPPQPPALLELDAFINADTNALDIAAWQAANDDLRKQWTSAQARYNVVARLVAADQAAGMTPAAIRAKAAANGYPPVKGPDGKVVDDFNKDVIEYTREQPTGYAEGGVVSAPVYGGTPQAPEATNIASQYASYVQQAQAAGMPVVSMEQFMAIQGQAMQNAPTPPMQGYAGGGVVSMEDDTDFGMPSAAGKMVIDTDPDAETDSIPAMVDGTQPAALNSGEFVMPTDVAMYYGTKFLNSLIEKARSGNTDAIPVQS